MPHDAYKTELSGLRDQLKAGLSQATSEPSKVTVADLAERIKALKASHTIETGPERTAVRRVVAEEPVTTRILRRTVQIPSVEPEPAELAAIETAPQILRDEPMKAVIDRISRAEPERTARPPADHWQQIARDRRKDHQPGLF